MTVRALFLYSEVAPYFLDALTHLVAHHPVEARVVHWPRHPDAPFETLDAPGVASADRRSLDDTALRALAGEFRPDVVYVSGWMDRGYLRLARRLRRSGVPVLCGIDTPWTGSLRQRAAALAGRWMVRRCFTHAWVAGEPQAELARRLGFGADRVLTGVYTADVERFRPAAEARAARAAWPRVFLYVGRLLPHKGVEDLVEAFGSLGPGHGWRLRLVGEGPLRDALETPDGCTVEGFVQPGELPGLAAEAGCFVLPSRREPWGVVLHEFAAAGLPLVASRACGAGGAFLEEGRNGFGHPAGDPAALAGALRRVVRLTDEELRAMGRRSRALAERTTPEGWAGTLLSVARGGGG